MIDITILTKYTSKGASSRYRYFLYINELLAKDTNIEIDSFLDTSYLHNLYDKNKKNKVRILFSYFKRFFTMLNSANNLIIEYEIFPYLPYFIEKIFLNQKKYILNFDDNVWENYKNKPLLKNKFDNLVKNANGIIVANEFLKDKVSQLNNNIIKIPTVINLEHYKQDDSIDKFDKFSLIWIGSPATFSYIESNKHIFIKLAKKIKYQLVIIASKKLEQKQIDGIDMVFYDWSASMEVELIKKSHLGIMPLNKDLFSQGKSSFKLIQYMASGLPSIASDIGENRNVIEDNKSGFLVNSQDEWINAIMKLYKDRVLYDSFSKRAKETSYNYSMQKYFKKFYFFADEVFNKK
jgi:glycosyltransferase involved in cell wall biosynthesis